MKPIQIFLVLAMLLAITTFALSTATPSSDDDQEPLVNDDHDDEQTLDHDHSQELTTSLRGAGRFLASRTRVNVMKCNKYPRVCRAAGSPGPDCCKKKCVNVWTDRLNCGKCGKKCKYSEICCKGQCVNPMSHKKHCGGCNNNCKKGSYCAYGMCSYA